MYLYLYLYRYLYLYLCEYLYLYLYLYLCLYLKKAPKRHPGAPMRHPEGTQKAPGRHPGGTQGHPGATKERGGTDTARRGHKEAKVPRLATKVGGAKIRGRTWYHSEGHPPEPI